MFYIGRETEWVGGGGVLTKIPWIKDLDFSALLNWKISSTDLSQPSCYLDPWIQQRLPTAQVLLQKVAHQLQLSQAHCYQLHYRCVQFRQNSPAQTEGNWLEHTTHTTEFDKDVSLKCIWLVYVSVYKASILEKKKNWRRMKLKNVQHIWSLRKLYR